MDRLKDFNQYINEGYLMKSDMKEMETKKGYVKTGGKYGQITTLYPKLRNQEVTYIHPVTDQLTIVGFQSLVKLKEKHKGKTVYQLDV